MMEINCIEEFAADLYNNYSLISKDLALYKNINLIPHIQKGL